MNETSQISNTAANTTILTSRSFASHSPFEQHIINAYTEQSSLSLCYVHIFNAYNSIETHIINSLETNTPIIPTINIIERLKRISRRKSPKITILISQIYFKLIINKGFYNKLSPNNITILISLANEIINSLDIIKSLYFCYDIVFHLHSFILYITSLPNINGSQKETLLLLINDIPNKYYSNSYNKYVKDNNNNNNKFTFDEMNNALMKTFSINEQFCIVDRMNTMLINENEFLVTKDNAVMFGDMLRKMIFSFDYYLTKVDDVDGSSSNSNKMRYFLIDATKVPNTNVQTKSHNKIEYEFIKNKHFKLYNNNYIMLQKTNIKSLLQLTMTYISTIISNTSYNTNFNILYNIFTIIKSVYNNYTKQNEIIFDNETTRNEYNTLITATCTQFNTLLSNDNTSQLHKHIISNDVIPLLTAIISNNAVHSYDNVDIYNMNFNVCNYCTMHIESGDVYTCYIDANSKSSLVYVEFYVDVSDVSFAISKWSDSEDKFTQTLKLDKVECVVTKPCVVVLFSGDGGLYKVEFDNSFSWVTSKELTYRIVVLEAVDDIVISDNVNEEYEGKTNVKGNEDGNGKRFYCFYENKHYTFDINAIKKLINESNNNNNNNSVSQSVVNVITYKNKLIFLNNNTQHEQQQQNEYPILSQDFFEKIISSQLNLTSNTTSITLNVYSLNQNLPDKSTLANNAFQLYTTSTTNFVPNPIYTRSILHVGFYPYTLLTFNPHLHYNCHALSDICTLYHIYLQYKANKSVNNAICCILFANEDLTQVSLYNEGGLFSNIKGVLKLNSLSLTENATVIHDFILGIDNQYDGIDIVVALYNVDETIKQSLTNTIKNVCTQNTNQINYTIHDSSFVEEAIQYKMHFFNTKACTIFTKPIIDENI